MIRPALLASLFLFAALGCGKGKPTASTPTASSPPITMTPATAATPVPEKKTPLPKHPIDEPTSAPAPKPAPKITMGKPIPISPMDLWQEYGENLFKADSKYKDKLVEISNSNWKIDRDENGRPFLGFIVVGIALMTNRDLAALPARERAWYKRGWYPPSVRCYLSKDGEKAVADLKEYSKIKVVGKVIGNKTADVWKDYVVEIEDCNVEKSP